MQERKHLRLVESTPVDYGSQVSALRGAVASLRPYEDVKGFDDILSKIRELDHAITRVMERKG